jgi:hypothetical protein
VPVFVLWFAAGAALLADVRVVDTLAGEEFTRLGIVGQLLERPAGVSDRDFAIQVMEAEGLTPFSGDPILVSPGRDGGLGAAVIVAANGQEIYVTYVVGDSARPGRVCRLRFQPGSRFQPARREAHRWCAAAFGVTLPAPVPPPPIFTVYAHPTVSGDFDRDGLEDRAYFRSDGGSHEIVVDRGARGGGTVVVAPAADPSRFYLGVLAPGTYRTACGKGFGPRGAPCPETSVTLDAPTLEFGGREASQAVAIWDGERFRVVWLSD